MSHACTYTHQYGHSIHAAQTSRGVVSEASPPADGHKSQTRESDGVLLSEIVASEFYFRHTTPQLNPKGYVRHTIPHVRPETIASWLLAGRVIGRKSDGLLPSSQRGDGLRLYSIIFDVDGAPGLHHLDAVDALEVRDKLVRVKQRRVVHRLSTDLAEAGISFCNGVLRILEYAAPEAYSFSVDVVYPFITAPTRLIASSIPNDPRLRKGADLT